MPDANKGAGWAQRVAYVVTGPTSGFGRAAAVELGQHGLVVLVGRDRGRLEGVQDDLKRRGGEAVAVVCDLSEPASVQHAVAQIIALDLPIAGILNNAGMRQAVATTNSLGWDMSFASNHLGPFAFTESLMPHLRDGTSIVFVVSAVEDPERKPAVAAGFRGGRYVSAASSAQGLWREGGSVKPGFDAYATSKQAVLAAALGLAREMPRLRINAVEPGLSPTTGLGHRSGRLSVRFFRYVVAPVLVWLLMPFIGILTTPRRAGRLMTDLVLNASAATGMYYDERGRPMNASSRVRDPQFQQRVLAETRLLLSGATEPAR